MLIENDPVNGWSIRMYNFTTERWVPVSLPFLQDAPPLGLLYLTASSGGLLCFETANRQNFIICNPITKKWRHLQNPVPGFSERTCPYLNPYNCIHECGDTLTSLTGLIVDEEKGIYKFVVASLAESAGRPTFVFNSLTRSWTKSA
jgi:hypothetical protein